MHDIIGNEQTAVRRDPVRLIPIIMDSGAADRCVVAALPYN